MQILRGAVISQGEDPTIVDEFAVLYGQEAPTEAGKLGEGTVDMGRECGVDGAQKGAALLFELFRGELGRVVLVLLALVEEIPGPTKAALIVEYEAEGERRFGVGMGLYGAGLNAWTRRLGVGGDVSHSELEQL